MDINWYGLSCFRIRESGVTIVCDPYDKSVGITLPRLKADLVTVSHDQPGHNSVERVTGEPKVFSAPGEYEAKNVFVTGLHTYHRRQNGHAERNVVFFFEVGDFTVGHLGDLGEIPSQNEIEELNIGEIDVLMVPVGGGHVLDPTRAVEIIGVLEPRIVVPMHYAHAGLRGTVTEHLGDVDRFLKELGIPVPEPQDVLKLSKANVPEETQVVLLNLSQ